MNDTEFKELVRVLNQPHRVANVFALFKHCEKAAALLQEQRDQIKANEASASKPAKKAATKKSS
jgi:hypothetical protein